jgi:beta-N-acetylhexosaminidase
MATINVGQFLVVGFMGAEISSETREWLDEVQPGGVVLFTRNIRDEKQCQDLTRYLRTELPWRPLVAIDQEGGRVNRLRNLVGEMPTIAGWKKEGSPTQAYREGKRIGAMLKELGVDLNFAPVLDLELFDESVDNALRERCWGRDAVEVVAWAGEFVRGLSSENIAACGKHFPGLGAARSDSHEQLPVVDRSLSELQTEDLAPYGILKDQLAAVMVGHGCYPCWDGIAQKLPASLSQRIITGVLRDEIGFEGLVVTDDLEMGAVGEYCPFEEAVVEAFCAGADMLLVCHTMGKAVAAHRALSVAVENGRVNPHRLMQSLRRMEEFRRRWIGC